MSPDPVVEERKDISESMQDRDSLLKSQPQEPSGQDSYPSKICGKPHVVFELIQALRSRYLELGFEEVINPIIIDRSEVYKQFGSEAGLILDRCFFLAGLPRPDLGLSSEKLAEMEKLGIKLDPDKISKLRSLFRKYKASQLDPDGLVDGIHELGLERQAALKLLDQVFPELKDLAPQPSSLTLRSHMTGGWFITLSELIEQREPPLKLFSIDRVFRREQREDRTHLRSHHSASCVYLDSELEEDLGKELSLKLLEGFFSREKIRFKLKKVSSSYYAPGTETEVYVRSPHGWIEVIDFGFYNPEALSRYEIPYPVLNLGLGVERLAMAIHGIQDLRELIYPWRFWRMDDSKIASMLKLELIPNTSQGNQIMQSLKSSFLQNADHPSPCEFLAWEGIVHARRARVWVMEPEPNKKLCGPAYLNQIVVHDGNILGIPRDQRWEKIFRQGALVGISYLDGFCAKAAHWVESMASKAQPGKYILRVRMVDSASDINLKIPPSLLRYLDVHSKKIDIRGPLFLSVKLELE